MKINTLVDMASSTWLFAVVLTSFGLSLGSPHEANGANMKKRPSVSSAGKSQIELAFEIFCEAESRALADGKGSTPRSILKFLNDLSISKYSFPTKAEEKKFYDNVEAKKKLLAKMFWDLAKEFKHDKKSLRPRMERAENDASVRSVPSKCDLSVSEKLQILSELL